MSFFKLIKKFFLIFGSKLDRTLDELDDIKNRSHRIKQGYQEAKIKLTKTREEIEGKFVLYENKVKTANVELDSLNKAFLKAAELKESDEVLADINDEISAAEQQLVVLQETLQLFSDQIEDLDQENKQLEDDIRQANNTLDLAEVRYQSAKDLIAINSEGIPDSLRAQIDKVRKDADEMDARYKGVKRVKEKAKPTREKLIKQFSSSVSVEDRLKALQNKTQA